MAWRRNDWLGVVAAVMVVVVVAAATPIHSPGNNYQALAGHQLWQAEGGEAMRLVAGLEGEGHADVLGHSSSSPRFRVAPHSRAGVAAALREAGIPYKVLVHDLASHIRNETDRDSMAATLREESCTETSCPSPLHDSYMTFEEMEWYLTELAGRSSRVEVKSIGKSIEGRDIWRVYIKATSRQETETEQKSVWIEGGLHAREWISPAVAFLLIEYMLTNQRSTRNVDVYVVPMANPDGYEYSWTADRLWRKNRRPNNEKPRCPGVDLNRNWDESFGVGASSNPCSEVYKGTQPFSEPETQALRDEMLRVSEESKLSMMLSLHSYGQLLLHPWGSTTNPAPGTKKMKRAGRKFARAAKNLEGTEYTVANSASGLYFASGTTDDWALAALETPLSYTLELRDEGRFSFQLPPNQIESTSLEVWAGVKKLFSYIKFKL